MPGLLLLLLGGGSALELGGAAEGRGESGVVDMFFMAGVCVGVWRDSQGKQGQTLFL